MQRFTISGKRPVQGEGAFDHHRDTEVTENVFKNQLSVFSVSLW
jgi:hypothetical protein